ncbi:hypothetical protein Tco_0545749 [Tanacetum coccineum]
MDESLRSSLGLQYLCVNVHFRMRELVVKYKAEKVCHEEMVKMPLVDLKMLKVYTESKKEHESPILALPEGASVVDAWEIRDKDGVKAQDKFMIYVVTDPARD